MKPIFELRSLDPVIERANSTAVELPHERLITESFLDWVSARPEHPAVADASGSLTYAEFAVEVLAVAAYLAKFALSDEVCVGIYAEPSRELMIAIWGVLLAGKAYLPLSPDYPDDRVRYMIEDSRTAKILTQPSLRDRLRGMLPDGVEIITIDEIRSRMQHVQTSTGVRGPNRHSLAYVIYTSGSTGTPNGVMIEHHSLINQMYWLKTACELDERASILQKTPMSFDAAQCEILALACGSTVSMGPPGVYRDPERLVDVIRETGVTHAIFVPTLLRALLDTDEFQNCKRLTHIYCGGEALPKRLAIDCVRLLPACRLINMYGPTECTINTSAYVVEPSIIEDGPDVVSIGGPLTNTHYFIVTDRGTSAGIGEVGELLVAGRGLARGYLNRPGLTAERFVAFHDARDGTDRRVYRTGDLAYWTDHGTVQYVGRVDTQVKLRGYRVELDEVKARIERHEWVRRAIAIVKDNPNTGYQNLIAYVELDPRTAATMDHEHQSAHHRSKLDKTQVMLQLANGGARESWENEGKCTIFLPNIHPTPEQVTRAFARKTYRFFDGSRPTMERIIRLFARRPVQATFDGLERLNWEQFGTLLRDFGAFRSSERLLPKFAYASPGALYATQMYLEIERLPFLASGIYYYDPFRHALVLIHSGAASPAGTPGIRVHFIGKRRAIEPVYTNNVREVLEMEVGHMVGLFEEVLPDYGLSIEPDRYDEARKRDLDLSADDEYLGTFRLRGGAADAYQDGTELYFQAHGDGVLGLGRGLYRFADGSLSRVADEIVRKRDVIAINQAVYDRASFGITIVSPYCDWMQYVRLGRKLQSFQMNEEGLGFMSAGYSSKTRKDLPSAVRIRQILGPNGTPVDACYFCLGGGVSPQQVASRGMNEDRVHMKGPAEILADDLADSLPAYMVPNRVLIVDSMPMTVNGKIDVKALQARDVQLARREQVPPTSDKERKIHDLWKHELKVEDLSITDNFFELGGNSLIAVRLTNRINAEFHAALPLQAIFESPTIEKFARNLDCDGSLPISRLVKLHNAANGRPLFCWPGLGGYCMNLRALASKLDVRRPFYGIQARGINAGEEPRSTVGEMALEDIELIRGVQRSGPYTLLGYSFGARVAFETAFQLEKLGATVDALILIAPGSPEVGNVADDERAGFENQQFVAILFSVFTGTLRHPALSRCVATVRDEAAFTRFVVEELPGFEEGQVKQIVAVASRTFQFKYSFTELRQRRVQAPITIIRARGDDYSFIEGSEGYSDLQPTTIDVDADHYAMLKQPGLEELTRRIRERLLANDRPHLEVNPS